MGKIRVANFSEGLETDQLENGQEYQDSADNNSCAL